VHVDFVFVRLRCILNAAEELGFMRLPFFNKLFYTL